MLKGHLLQFVAQRYFFGYKEDKTMESFENEHGFVTQWLISGTDCHTYIPPENLPKTWSDQLGYEKALRDIFYTPVDEMPQSQILPGANSPIEKPWHYYYSHKNWFVDQSSTHSLLTTIRFDAATILHSNKMQNVPATFWTYDALDVWVNGVRVLKAQPPVYKPIAHYDVTLPLVEGSNSIYVMLHNLAVRDTRNLFALQLRGGENLTVAVPGGEAGDILMRAGRWLDDLICANGKLTAQGSAPGTLVFDIDGKQTEICSKGPWDIPNTAMNLKVLLTVSGQQLTRSFELIENIHPLFLPSPENHGHLFLERLASVKWEKRGSGAHFAAFNVLARLALNCSTPEDDDLLMGDLDFVESRGDCSDFLVGALLRIAHNYPMNAAVKERMKHVLLNFRFWMDEEGSDGMCFWSENHALMFYGTQLAAGMMYPDDVFVRSGRTGREQAEIAAARCREWLDDVERDGVEEFNSASYMPVTMGALLVLVDFAPEDISKRASAVLDSLLRQLCMHVFKGSVISPQGRVYRDVIHPSRQTVQTLLHLINPYLPYGQSESIWCVSFATTKYRLPSDLIGIMGRDVHTSYSSGNARIELSKTPDYLLTSVHSPRDPEDAPKWENLCFVPNADRSTNTYVKSLNERFHGTSVFEPGVYGYQQHLWYAALSNEAVIFVNHPGAAADMDKMRPGYWYGNGVMPAVRQKGNLMGAIYQIPDDHPITFTHTFWPQCKFDEDLQNGHWLFGRVKDGYVGLWCSGDQVAYEDVLHACEYRCYGTNTAYCCMCGSKQEYGSFADFQQVCLNINPQYDTEASHLQVRDIELTHVPCVNKTQFI